MQSAEYKKMADFEKSYWWHRGRLSLLDVLIKDYLNRSGEGIKILEIGCGTGEVTKFLSHYGTVTALDISPEAINFARERGIKDTILGDVNQIDLSPFRERFDLIVALDVLEHIQDDVETIRRVQQMLKSGGYFIVCVPAYKFLWSEHDEALHHKRRYHSFEIMKKLKDGGFKIVKKTYFVTFAFPVIAIYRILSNFIGRSAYPQTSYIYLPKVLNELMIKVLKIETFLTRLISLPFGSTITVVVKKI